MVGQCFLGSIPPFTASIKTNRAATVSENELVLPVSAIFAAQLVREFAEIVKKSEEEKSDRLLRHPIFSCVLAICSEWSDKHGRMQCADQE